MIKITHAGLIYLTCPERFSNSLSSFWCFQINSEPFFPFKFHAPGGKKKCLCQLSLPASFEILPIAAKLRLIISLDYSRSKTKQNISLLFFFFMRLLNLFKFSTHCSQKNNLFSVVPKCALVNMDSAHKCDAKRELYCRELYCREPPLQ